MGCFGIYVHIPFCVKKCRYCDFNSGVYGHDLHDRYFDSLINEISDFGDSHSICADTVYIGGGTPSSVPVSYIGQVIDALRSSIEVTDDAEISIEVNPGTMNRKKAEDYRSLGINRVSIGLQSADDSVLKSLGRIHTVKDFDETFDALRESGFGNINTDLIYAVPGQTLESLSKTLDHVAKLGPEHISAYSLIIEPGTPLYDDVDKGIVKPVDEDTDRLMSDMCLQMLRANGYGRYEISNLSKKGFECRHNLKYWRRDPYVGFGAGAHSMYGDCRYANVRDVNKYVSCDCNSESEKIYLSEDECAREQLMLGLRLSEGIDTVEFEDMYGIDLFEDHPVIGDMVKGGLIEVKGSRIALTDRGMDIMNSVLIELGV